MLKGKPRILVLGAGIMQGPALKIACEMGFEVVAVDADPEAPCVSFADRFRQIDLKDREGIEAFGRSLLAEGGLSGIMTAGTDFSATVAWAAEKLNLPGISYQAALDASDKERMRKKFKEKGVPSPDFIILKSPPSANGGFGEKNALPFPFPVVVKPVDNMGSRGCSKVESFGVLDAAVSSALKFSRSGRVIVEEFMEGPEFSVDALVFEGDITICGIADRHIFFPPYFIEMGHTMPSSQSPAVIDSLLETFAAGIKALGITCGAAKGDIKLTPQGPMIGEIAARLSGGYMSGWTYPYSSGVMPAQGAIEIASGKKPSRTKPEWNWTSAERAFISIPGTVHSITGLEKAQIMPLVKNVFSRVKCGSIVDFPQNNVTKCGNVISAAESRLQAVAAAETAARSVLIRLKAPDEATESFLFRLGEPFPPDAFALDSRLLQLLYALPEGAEGSGVGSGESLAIMPFPEFAASGITDYVGRGVNSSLDAVRLLTDMELPYSSAAAAGPKNAGELVLGRSFWKAFVRGGYQGAAYFIDKLRETNG